MAATQKLPCVVEQIAGHGERVYTVTLRPARPTPRFRAGQFLHLALDPYDPTGFWPDSRVFSIASPATERHVLRITYAVHGVFTTRMERELTEGRQVWIKMPYGEFVIDDETDVALFAGGTGVTAFTAFLEDLPADARHSVTLAYGARTNHLLTYRAVVDRCAARVPSLSVQYFVEHDPVAALPCVSGAVSVDAIWPNLSRPRETSFYISGPPSMLKSIRADLLIRSIAPEAIQIDAWE